MGVEYITSIDAVVFQSATSKFPLIVHFVQTDAMV